MKKYPSEEELQKYKQAFGKVFEITNGSATFICRPVKRNEWVHVAEEDICSFKKEEKLVNLCLLWCSDDDYLNDAGIYSSLSDAIMDVSGFGDMHAREIG